MPEPWGADVHADLRVYFDVHGRAYASAASADVNVERDVLAKIAVLRLRADQFEVWLRAWSEQKRSA